MKMKTLLSGVAVLAVVSVGATLGTSIYAEKQYNERLQEATEWLSANMPEASIEVVSYQRGLFTSNARFLVNWDFARTVERNTSIPTPIEFDAPQPAQFVVDSQIQNGPWLGGVSFGLGRIDAKVNVNPATVDPQFVQALGGKDFITAQTILGFGKDFSSEIKGASFEQSDADGELHYKGFSATLKTSNSRKIADFNITFPYLMIETGNEGKSLLISNWTYEARGASLSAPWMISGQHNISVDNFTLKDKSRNVDFELNKTSFAHAPQHQGDLYFAHSSLSISGNYQGKPIGMQFEMDVKNLNYPIWAELMQASQSGNQREFMQIMEQNGIDFLKTSPALSISPFTIEYNGEKANFSLQTSVGEISTEEMQGSPTLILLSKLNFQLGAQIPTAFVTSGMLSESTQEQFQNAIAQGIFVPKDNNYVSDFSINSGKIMLNGQSIR